MARLAGYGGKGRCAVVRLKGWNAEVWTEAPEDYRHERFRLGLLIEDLSFSDGTPVPGQEMPDFELPTTDGVWVRKSDFVGRRPALITFGSITCAMTASAGPALRRLHERYGDQVAFLTLYVREAHPGERLRQPRTFDEKALHARAYKERDGIPWPVMVDTLDGDLHRLLGGNTNAAYLMDRDGTIGFRSLFSNDEAVLARGLEAIITREPDPLYEEYAPKVVPAIKGAGALGQVLEEAGQTAKADVLREAAPVYGMGRLAGLFRPLSYLGRGLAAVGVVAGVVGAVAIGVVGVLVGWRR
jgi:hypothetical protein